jgi:hypothetical protein
MKKWSYQKRNGNIILGRMGNSMLKWCGHLVRMADNRWPKGILSWSQQGRRQRAQPEVGKGSWENMKQRNIVSDDAVNWQLWLLNTNIRRTIGKLITYIRFESKLYFVGTEEPGSYSRQRQEIFMFSPRTPRPTPRNLRIVTHLPLSCSLNISSD